jgi:hypothetical protein
MAAILFCVIQRNLPYKSCIFLRNLLPLHSDTYSAQYWCYFCFHLEDFMPVILVFSGREIEDMKLGLLSVA